MKVRLAIMRIVQEVDQIKREIDLIKNILLSEGELTEWAKGALAQPRETPETECVSNEEAEDR